MGAVGDERRDETSTPRSGNGAVQYSYSIALRWSVLCSTLRCSRPGPHTTHRAGAGATRRSIDHGGPRLWSIPVQGDVRHDDSIHAVGGRPGWRRSTKAQDVGAWIVDFRVLHGHLNRTSRAWYDRCVSDGADNSNCVTAPNVWRERAVCGVGHSPVRGPQP